MEKPGNVKLEKKFQLKKFPRRIVRRLYGMGKKKKDEKSVKRPRGSGAVTARGHNGYNMSLKVARTCSYRRRGWTDEDDGERLGRQVGTE